MSKTPKELSEVVVAARNWLERSRTPEPGFTYMLTTSEAKDLLDEITRLHDALKAAAIDKWNRFPGGLPWTTSVGGIRFVITRNEAGQLLAEEVF